MKEKRKKKEEKEKGKEKSETRTVVPGRIYDLKEVRDTGYDILSYVRNLKWSKFLKMDEPVYP